LGCEDIEVLHCVRMRGPAPSLSELLLFLNRHDVANLQYSLRKLTKMGLIESCRRNKRESRFSLTARGMHLTSIYAAIRDETLVRLCADEPTSLEALDQASSALEHLVGVYDQATQALLNRRFLGNKLEASNE